MLRAKGRRSCGVPCAMHACNTSLVGDRASEGASAHCAHLQAVQSVWERHSHSHPLLHIPLAAACASGAACGRKPADGSALTAQEQQQARLQRRQTLHERNKPRGQAVSPVTTHCSSGDCGAPWRTEPACTAAAGPGFKRVGVPGAMPTCRIASRRLLASSLRRCCSCKYARPSVSSTPGMAAGPAPPACEERPDAEAAPAAAPAASAASASPVSCTRARVNRLRDSMGPHRTMLSAHLP